MNHPQLPASGLRSVARDAVREKVADVALDLFVEHGFDEVTIAKIAESAGSSPAVCIVILRPKRIWS